MATGQTAKVRPTAPKKPAPAPIAPAPVAPAPITPDRAWTDPASTVDEEEEAETEWKILF